MSSAGSVSHWITQLKAGDHTAAQPLWELYFQRLVGLARKKLRGQPRRAADEEDVALSAFTSFCRGAAQGRFPLLSDRHNLWQLLVVITARKALHLIQHEQRQKRGGGAVRGESAVDKPPGSSTAEAGLERILGPEPTPAFAAQLAEEYQLLLGQLGDEQLRSIAVWKMEGYTTEEIAAKLDCAPRTVQRKLRMIRTLWKQEIAR
jgi:DNA-directed RNA polymerase specialized sigma24 family protein